MKIKFRVGNLVLIIPEPVALSAGLAVSPAQGLLILTGYLHSSKYERI